MTVKTISIRAIDQRLADQTWRYATAALATVPGFAFAIENDRGEIGLGYARAMPPAGLPPKAMQGVLEYLAEALAGRDEADVAGAMDAVEARMFSVPMAKAAIECALMDLAAKAAHAPLHRLFGERRHDRLPQSRILPLKTPGEMADGAVRLMEQGYRFLKVKASGDIALDLARLAAVAAVARGRARLMVDANQSYRASDAVAAIGRMADHGVELVEQPTPADDPEGFARVCRASALPIEADESAQTLREIQRLADERLVASINVRILNIGGARNALRAAAICKEANISCRLGASFGPRLPHAFSAHLAATLPAPLFAHEVAEFEHILDDPFEGLDVRNGELAIPDGVGCGVRWR